MNTFSLKKEAGLAIGKIKRINFSRKDNISNRAI